MSHQPSDIHKIAIIGLGYVGLPLALRFSEAKVHVLGLDTDQKKVDLLTDDQSYIGHISSDRVQAACESGRFEPATDFSRIQEVEAVLICVPTPLTKNREPDLSFVLESGKAIAPYLAEQDNSRLLIADNENDEQKSPISHIPSVLSNHSSPVTRQSSSIRHPKLVVLESTTYPGTTDTELRDVLETGSGLKAGEGFHLGFSPEREDPGRKDHSVKTIPKVVGGYTEACLQRCMELYGLAMDQVYPVSSCRVAEATKLTENVFRSVNIALVNELKMVYEKMGIDIWEVLDAAETKPFGYMRFDPGPGWGGHCIPIDPFYLAWKAQQEGMESRFIELAGEINTEMPDHVISVVERALAERGSVLEGASILLLGIAYKPNVDDDRNSASYVLMERLEARGAKVSFHDPYVEVIKTTRDHADLAGRKRVEISDAYDAVLLATHHEAYTGYDFSAFRCPLVDTRNCVRQPPRHYVKA